MVSLVPAPPGHELAPALSGQLPPHAVESAVAEIRKHDDAADQREQNGQFRVHGPAFFQDNALR